MRTLLRLDASAQRRESRSRGLADYYESRWREKHRDGTVITRDLARDPVPHLDEETIAVFYAGGSTRARPLPAGVALSDQLIDELVRADDVVVSSAVYNFTLPSSLKAWLDHVVRFGSTVEYGEEGPVGLLTGKRACFLTARGGNRQTSPDYSEPTVRAVFEYIGFTSFDWISLEGTRIPDGELDRRLSTAHAAIDELLVTER